MDELTIEITEIMKDSHNPLMDTEAVLRKWHVKHGTRMCSQTTHDNMYRKVLYRLNKLVKNDKAFYFHVNNGGTIFILKDRLK